MKKIRIMTALVVAAMVGTTAVYAQDDFRGNLFGLVPGASTFTIGDMLNYSQTTGVFNTARSTAMGGAFTSLGGDLSSIGGNPAGLGMYRASAWGFSPSMSFSEMSNSHQYLDNNKNTFGVNNFGVALNLSQKSSGIVSFTLGLSYNKAADFNFRTGYEMDGGGYSLNDIFALQLNGLSDYLGGGDWNSYQHNDLRDPYSSSSPLGLHEWGAAMALQSGAITAVDKSGGLGQEVYRTGSIHAGTELVPDGASIIPVMQYESKGYIGEYNIAGGMNIENKFYLGFGMTVQDITQRQHIGYTEEYNYRGYSPQYQPGANDMEYMHYDQHVYMNGSGVNFKLGMIFRPIPSFRLGFAVHTPTFVTLNHDYRATMNTGFYNRGVGVNSKTPTNMWQYKYNTPTRLMAGASLTLGNFLIVSADYEYIFYDQMKLRDGADYNTRERYNADIKEMYKGTHNYRAGVELRPVSAVSIRAGYSHYGSPYRNDEERDRFTTSSSDHISAGLGFRLGKRVYMDLAYVYSMTNYMDLVTYDYYGDVVEYDAGGNASYYNDASYFPSNGEYEDSLLRDIKQKRHIATASFTFMF